MKLLLSTSLLTSQLHVLSCRLLLLLLLLMLPHHIAAQECTDHGGQKKCDTHERCPVWKEQGMCLLERSYMTKYCPASCAAHDESILPVDNDNSGGECQDAHERCQVWADLGECDENAVEMEIWCPKACGVCGGDDDSDDDDDDDEDAGCSDKQTDCKFWADRGECQENAVWMKANCPKSCNVCPETKKKKGATTTTAQPTGSQQALLEQSAAYGTKQTAEGAQRSETIRRVQEALQYMKTDQVTTLPKKIQEDCKNRHELCSFWAGLGECTNNAAYMATNCAVACMSCHLIDFSTRCPPLENPKPALLPGDLNKMFERIVATAPGNRTLTKKERKELAAANMTEYTVHIHSQPKEYSSDEYSVITDKSSPPWVVTFENFLTPEECQAMIELGYKYEYKRSEDVGEEKFDGSHTSVQSSSRTSENSWCSDFAGCRKEELPQKLHERIATVLGIPANNSEDFQMLKYEPGTFYRRHHDYIPHQKDRQCGPRILTFFLYLSDVEAGGGTNFPQLDITVMPKKGRALLWPSILNAEPMEIDKRTSHQAMDVEKGVKFATNGWIHMYDYVTPQAKGCN